MTTTMKEAEQAPAVETAKETRVVPANKRAVATASSAHARINVPLNVENWKDLSPDEQEPLVWFHQYALDSQMAWDDVAEAIGYDRSTVFKVLKGTYEGSLSNVLERIAGFRKLVAERSKIQKSEFAKNEISKLVHGAFDYAMASGGMVEVIGESGQGKSIAGRAWQQENNHGKTVWVECPVYGGMKGLLRKICAAVGANKNQNISQSEDSIRRAFNKNRILIIDEASRLLPSEKATPPRGLDFLRALHDETGCAVGLITTARFNDTLTNNAWMFEQFLGRIDLRVQLPREMGKDSYLPLVRQYVDSPSRELHALCKRIVNEPIGGRMRRLAKLLQFASRVAARDKSPLTSEVVLKAHAILEQMSGEVQWAKKGGAR